MTQNGSSTVHDPIRLNFELSPDLMVVLVTCKNEENLINNEGSCRNSNSSQLLCMSSLPARMKKIQSKIQGLECSQHFFYYDIIIWKAQ